MEFETMIEFTPQWEILQSVRAAVQLRMEAATQDERDGAVMVASELVENAIKYGQSTPTTGKKGQLLFSVEGRRVTISVSSSLPTEEGYKNICRQIAAIHEAEDPLQFYAEKVAELLGRKAHQSAGLGLCRIVAEGQFKLSAEWADKVLTMTATRDLDA